MKKFLTLAMTILLLFGLTACSKSESDLSGGALSVSDNTSSKGKITDASPINESSSSDEKITDTSSVHTHSFVAATCTQPKKCDCGATEGAALGHSYENGVCTRCSEKDSGYLTPFTEKKGNWRLNIISGNDISVVKVSVNGEDGDLGCLRGAPYDTYSKSLTDQRPDDSETINGVKYWYEVSDGCYLTFTTDNESVTFSSDEFDMKFTLTRIDENSMKVTSAENIPPRFYELKTGCIFNFEAE